MDLSEEFNRSVNSAAEVISNNRVVSTVLGLFFAMYASLAAPILPYHMTKILKNGWVKLTFMFLIAYMATKNPSVAIISSVALLVTLQTLHAQETSHAVLESIEKKMDSNIEKFADVEPSEDDYDDYESAEEVEHDKTQKLLTTDTLMDNQESNEPKQTYHEPKKPYREHPSSDSKKPSHDSKQSTHDSKQSTHDSKQPSHDSKQPTHDSKQPSSESITVSIPTSVAESMPMIMPDSMPMIMPDSMPMIMPESMPITVSISTSEAESLPTQVPRGKAVANPKRIIQEEEDDDDEDEFREDREKENNVMAESEQNINIVLENSNKDDKDDEDDEDDEEDLVDIILGFENFAPVNFKKNKKIERFQNNNNEEVSTGSCKDPYSFQGYQFSEYALI
jgi:hypothetical protein